jgi:hypothetical protein
LHETSRVENARSEHEIHLLSEVSRRNSSCWLFSFNPDS